jgi:hypothetical protein
MNSTATNRRQVLVGITSAGLGIFIHESAAQEKTQEPKLPFAPKDLGGIHEDMLNRISEEIGTIAIDTEQGLVKMVELLKNWGIINESDQRQLNDLIRAVFNAANPDVMMQKIEQIYKESVSKVGDVAAATISIARSSVTYAKKKAQENPRVVYIVSHDVLGALTGATIGRKLGPYFAVIGALAGAIGGSAEAALTHPEVKAK